jgi:DNA invertase Pin-like site-specific DNA recombinase
MQSEMIVGYARVSSEGQSLENQKQKLTAYGCKRLYSEKITGTTSNRAKMKEALDFVREGDKFVITRLDRLARSVGDLANLSKQLESKGVDLVVLDQKIDTSTATGKLMFNMIGAFAEFERDLIHERCKEGIERAKANGVKFGRKPTLLPNQLKKLKAEFDSGEIGKVELARKYGVSRASLYRLVKTV